MRISKPNRVTRSYTQQLVAKPDRVFPLLCPVREADWIEGWQPELVVSESGVAELDCIFITPSLKPTYWMITRYERDAGFVEMVRFTPGLTACRLSIQVRESGDGSAARVTYSHTSLGPEGDAYVAAFTEETYGKSMRDWQARMNHYLQTGTMLRSPG